jgi:hypothetical protein
MSAYDQLYDVISQDDYYNMDWSLSVALEPDTGDIVNVMHMQFVGWGPKIKQGVTFYEQDGDGDLEEIPESQALVNKFIDFFEEERKRYVT